MARLPQPGGDSGNWGDILNSYLSQSHTSDGSLKDNVVGASQLKDKAVTATAIADDAITSDHIAPGAITKSDVGLGSVDNTADADKPVSTATQTALTSKLNTADLDAQTAARIGDSGSATSGALGASINVGVLDGAKKKSTIASSRAVFRRAMKTWDAHVDAGTARCYIFGHSIVEGYNASNRATTAFAPILSGQLASLLNVTTTIQGIAGNTTTQLLAALTTPATTQSLVVLMAVTNDYHYGVASATTKTNLQAIIAKFRASPQPAPGPSFLILGEWQKVTTGSSIEPWVNYLEAAREVADEDVNVAFMDFGTILGDSADDPASLNLIDTDGTHPTDAGHKFIAYEVLREIIHPLAYANASSNAPVLVGCKAARTTNQGIPTGSFLASECIIYDGAEGWDTDNVHNTVTNASRFTIPTGKGGVWRFVANVRWDPSSVGDRGIFFFINGVIVGSRSGGATVRAIADGVNAMAQTATADLLLVAGDYVEVLGYQTTGGTLNLTSTCSAQFLGAAS